MNESPEILVGEVNSVLATVPSLNRFFEYWRTIGNGKSMPSRADFDPTEVKRHLPYLSLIEVCVDRDSQGKDYFYRVAASVVESLSGISLQNTHLSDFPNAKARRIMKDACDACVAEAAPTTLSGRMLEPDRDHYDFVSLLLPLSDDSITVDRILILSYFPDIE